MERKGRHQQTRSMLCVQCVFVNVVKCSEVVTGSFCQCGSGDGGEGGEKDDRRDCGSWAQHSPFSKQ